MKWTNYQKKNLRSKYMKRSVNVSNVFSLPMIAIGIVTGISPSFALAFQIDTGESDVRLRWDNTLKYSNAFRVKDQSEKLISNPNTDDGDRNFDQGLISNRVDLLSELDLVYKGFGARVSGAAWYDSVYHNSNDNDSPLTANQGPVNNNKFLDDTEELHGQKAELLDAFVFGRGSIGETRLSFRAGQYAQQWGETLFFGTNGIAGGQAPVDVIKGLSVPGTQFKELIRPTEQLSASIQPSEDLLISVYYQTEWEKTRLPGVGSYFSSNDLLDAGGNHFLFGQVIAPGEIPANALYLNRGPDLDPKNSGQGGIQIRFRLPNGRTDYGIYAIRYHDKTPQLYIQPGTSVDESGRMGSYFLAYQEDVRAYGISANHTFGNLNLGVEVSARRNTALVNDGVTLAPGVIPSRDDPLYPVGNSVHANVSAFWTLPVTSFFSEASLLAEVAWNKLTSISDNPEALAAEATKQSVAIRFLFTPTYRQVLSGLDLDLPIGVGYTPRGTSSVVSSFGPEHGGDITLGVNATYLNTWKASLNMTHYFGPEDTGTDELGRLTFKQTLKDRDFIALSVQRTF
jgi:hypothetical protein